MRRRLDHAASGSGAYLLEFLRCLRAAGYRIRIVVAPEAGFGNRPFARIDPAYLQAVDCIDWVGTVRLGSLYLSYSPRVLMRGFSRLLRGLLHALGGQAPSTASQLGEVPPDREMAQLARATGRQADILVVCEYSSLAPVLSRVDAHCRAVLLHDLFSMRAQAFLEAGAAPDHNPMTVEEEVAHLAHADLCIHASHSEMEQLHRHLPDAQHIWLKPGLEAPVAAEGVSADPTPRAAFIGVRHGGNRDALELLTHRIWPAVRARLPDARLQIFGEIAQDQPETPGIELIGPVGDLSAYCGPDAVGLAPMRITSGVSIKIATYFQLGMGVLAMPPAIDGFGDLLDGRVELASDEESYADALAALLSDAKKRHELAARGQQVFDGRLSNEPVVARLRDIADRAATAPNR
ncbi:MAG: glycosyltransferase family 4 protein [Pseudomonadota bacterium]